MKSYTKKIIGFLILLLVVSCAIESMFSLPNDELIKSELIGEWRTEHSKHEFLRIEKNNEKTYKLIIVDKEKTEELIAFSKAVKGFNIMNIITEYDGKVANLFYGFNIDSNTLTFSEVNDKLRENEFESETELLNFFKENINRDDFFINQTELVRK